MENDIRRIGVNNRRQKTEERIECHAKENLKAHSTAADDDDDDEDDNYDDETNYCKNLNAINSL